MRGAKAIDGRRVRLLVEVTARSGTSIQAGEVVTFHKLGVVRCMIEADDGRCIYVRWLRREDVVLVEDERRRPDGDGEDDDR